MALMIIMLATLIGQGYSVDRLLDTCAMVLTVCLMVAAVTRSKRKV